MEITQSCPSHLYRSAVVSALRKHGLGGAIGASLCRGRFAKTVSEYCEYAHRPEECALDIYTEWKDEKYSVSHISALDSTACVGVHYI